MTAPPSTEKRSGFIRELGLFDCVMVVIGAMIGSGIFIVSSDMARTIGSPGWLLVAWGFAGALTIMAALCYGELSSMMPEAGGMYIYLREAFSPLWGFLYGWTFFTVIQTGTIAAVSVAFARFTGVLWPAVSEQAYIVPPVHLSSRYAVSLSTAQLLAILVIGLLTWANTRGIRTGKIVQNLFTVAKTGALAALIVLGLFAGANPEALRVNFKDFWAVRDAAPIAAGFTSASAFGLFAALCVTQSGSLFSADSWHNVTFAAGEVKDPRRTLPRALAIGSIAVIVLYLLVNVAYLVTLPLPEIQNAPSGRVATAVLERIMPGWGAATMAAAVMVSTFGCINSLVLAGPRVYYAMAQNGLFFARAGTLNRAAVPGWSLVAQGVWAAAMVLPRTFDAASGQYGNLYSNLLDYVISAALVFYILAIAGVLRLRKTMPDAQRPYQVPGYPATPLIYIVGASAILLSLLIWRAPVTWPGLLIVAAGIPVYGWARQRDRARLLRSTS